MLGAFEVVHNILYLKPFLWVTRPGFWLHPRITIYGSNDLVPRLTSASRPRPTHPLRNAVGPRKFYLVAFEDTAVRSDRYMVRPPHSCYHTIYHGFEDTVVRSDRYIVEPPHPYNYHTIYHRFEDTVVRSDGYMVRPPHPCYHINHRLKTLG